MRLFLRLVLWLVGLVPWALSAQAQGSAFSCDGTFFQIRQVNGTSQLFRVDRSNPANYTTTPLNIMSNGTSNDLGVLLNGLAYNSQDGYMYALTTTGSSTTIPSSISLYKIGQGGIAPLGTVKVGNANLALIVATGTCDKAGRYYFSSQNTGNPANYNLYSLDLNSATPLAASVVSFKTPSGAASQSTFYDFAFNPVDGLLYGALTVGSLSKIDQSTGTVTSISTGQGSAVGSLAFDVAGNLFAYSNGTVGTASSASFYQVSTTSGAYTTISAIDPASVSDGASCINPGNSIDVTKTLTNVRAVSTTTFDISYAIRVRNTYTATLPNVQVSDILMGSTANSTFPTATSVALAPSTTVSVTNLDGSTLAANSAYTGLSATPSGSMVSGASLLTGTQSLTAGQRVLITYTVRVSFGSAGSVPTTAQNNTAYATSSSTSPNRGYTLSSSGVLLSPNDLVATDASTNTASFPALRANAAAYGTPAAVDAPAPTPVTFAPTISGTVFEDVNYGGGAGRTLGNGQGVPRGGARVELYAGSGLTASFVSAQLTATDGSYGFSNLTPGNSYVVRVVSTTVSSSRNTGGASGLVGVQTYRTSVTATSGTVPDPNRVGGEYPARAEATSGNGLLSALYVNTGTTQTAPQSIASITLSNTNAPAVAVDFGYNFDTVVNTNPSGQGSLAQFITNANALDNTNLDQDQASSGGSNPAAGVETSIFMISDGRAHDGLTAYNATANPGLASQLAGASVGVGGTVATIALANNALPTISGTYAASTSLDATTQTQNVGDTNSALRNPGSVGTAGTALSPINGPEVQLQGARGNFDGLTVGATNTTIRGLGAYGFANNIRVNADITNTLLEQNVLGASATSFADPGSNARTTGAGIYLNNSDNGTVRNNFVAFSGGMGIWVVGDNNGANNNLISGNEIRGNGQEVTANGEGLVYDGIELQNNSTGNTISGNLITANLGHGIDSFGNGIGGNTISGNTISNNGQGVVAGTGQEGSGLRLYGATNPTTVTNNVLNGNNGSGVLLANSAAKVTISQNSTFGNTRLGIDLLSTDDAGTTPNTYNGNTGTTPNVTLNSATTNGANGLLNYPVITSASLVGTSLLVQGYAKAGAAIELFIAQANNSTTAVANNYFGQGLTYLTTLTEGASSGVADTNPGTNQSYSGTINGVNQGADTNANGFAFLLPLSAAQQALVTSGALLTSTATLGTATSEFSGNVRVTVPPVANDVTNVNVPNNTVVGVVLDPNLSGTASGQTGNLTTNTANTIASYTVSPIATGGTLYYNGTAVTAATTVPAANLSQLTFIPTRGFVGNATFTYTATDANGATSTTHNTGGTVTSGPAVYTIPVVASADVTASLTGGTTLSAGLATGSYVATFTNLGPDAASGVTQTVTLPAGASLTTAQQNALPTGTTVTTTGSGTSAVTTITFAGGSTAINMANGAINSYRFAFTAPATVGSSTLTASTSTTSSEGANVAPNTASLALTTTAVIDVQASLAASAATVAPGTAATLTATFTNNSAPTAAGVVETVQLPTGLTPTSVSGQAAGTPSGNTIAYGSVATLNTTTGLLTYAATTLAGSGTVSSAIVFTMPTAGIVTGTASITTTTTESNPANNVASASIAAGPQFDLSTTLYGPTAVVAGAPVTLNVTTTNGGPQAVAGAIQTVRLPANLNATGAPNVFISNGGTYNNTSGVVTFPALGTLPSGQTVANTITFIAPSTSFSPSATVTPNTSSAGDTNPANNTAYLNGAATSTSPGATLAPGTATSTSANVYAILSTTATIVAAGTQVTYTAGLGNAGPDPATNATGKFQLLPGLGTTTLTVAGSTGVLSGGSVTYPNGASYNPTTGLLSYPTYATLASGATNTFAVVATVPATVGNNDQLLATAAVGSTTSDAVPADNVKAVAIAVLPTADVTTTLAGPTSGVVAGQSVTYTATFTNNGPNTASLTTETVQLPAGLTASSLLLNGATGTPSGTTITFASGATYSTATGVVTLPTIADNAAGAVQTFNLTFAAPAQNYVVSSAVGSATTDGALTNNAASVATTLTATSDVAVAVAGPATAVVGNYVTYTVTTTNNGPRPAANVVPTLQLPAGLTIQASGPNTTGTSYNSTTGLLTFATLGSLQAGVSAESYVTFTMPNAPGGQLSGVASVSSTSLDNVASNNTAALTTSVAPVSTATADVRTSLSAQVNAATVTSVAAGTVITYTAAYRNAGTGVATGVVPTLSLPAGLAATTLQVGGSTGTLANGLVTFGNGATYDVATGLLTFPTVASLAFSNNATSYTVAFPAPGSGSLIVISAVSSLTSDNLPDNNRANTNIAITPAFDLTTSLTGPAVALPGTQNLYTVTTTNSGPSPAAAAQTVTLPGGLTASTLLVAGQVGTPAGTTITYSNTGATYNTSTGLLTFPTISSLAPGSVTNSFTVTMPSSGTLTATASVTTSTNGETNVGNNTAALPASTATPSFAPVAANVINRKRSARGNTSNTNLSISGLNATDSDGIINNYTITSLPTSGTLYYNGQAITAVNYAVADTALLSYQPAAGFVGNAFFTYTATDDRGVVSNTALYTLPVAQDVASAYTAYNTAKGGSNTYKDGDVLAQLIDANTARYTSAGIIYNTLGQLQSTAANGLPTTGTNAVLASTGPSTNPSNALPAGVSLDPATGRIYVSNASQLVNNNTARTYSVLVNTTDLNGGVNQALASFTIGAYPLPVVLTDFTAVAVQNRDALLGWATASEKNNDHFEVERSFDGVAFAEIGRVAGHGTTSAASTYALTDAGVAARATGPVYYRLRQVDLDGTASYSPVRSVRFATTTASVALALFPNPTQASTTLDLRQLPATGTYQVTLLDATGRTVRSLTLGGGLPQVLDVQNLASGTYLVHVSGLLPDGSPLRQVLRLTKE